MKAESGGETFGGQKGGETLLVITMWFIYNEIWG